MARPTLGFDHSPTGLRQGQPMLSRFAQAAARPAPRIAQDRALGAGLPSRHSIDYDGHLRVTNACATRACVSPYTGREIPGWEKLGLNPHRTYRVLRDPAALRAAAESFRGKPISWGHNTDLTVGSVGSVAFDGATIRADLTIWDGIAVDAAKDGSNRALSAAYHYDAIRDPGTFNGTPYDLRMAKIKFTHLALVPEGRVPGARIKTSNGQFAPALDARFAKAPAIITKAELARRVAAAPGLTGAARAAALVRNEQEAADELARRFPGTAALKKRPW
jgi:hypothetical protein